MATTHRAAHLEPAAGSYLSAHGRVLGTGILRATIAAGWAPHAMVILRSVFLLIVLRCMPGSLV